MKDTKTILKHFTPYNLSDFEQYFENMATSGWMIEKLSGFSQRYRRIEPVAAKFKIMYIDTMADSVMISEPSKDFVELCEEMGWQHITTYNRNLFVFVSYLPAPPPIETDLVVQVDNIYEFLKRNMYGRFLGMLYFVRAIGNNINRFNKYPFFYFVELKHRYLFLYLLFIISDLIFMVWDSVWYHKARKMATEENRLPGNYKSPFWLVIALNVVAVGYVYYSSIGVKGLLITGCAIVFAIAYVKIGTNYRYKKNGKFVETNTAIQLAGGFLAMFAFIGAVTYVSMYDFKLPFMGREIIAVEDNGAYRWYAYGDRLPLAIEDLTEKENITYSYEDKTAINMPFLRIRTGVQKPNPYINYGKPELKYHVIETKNDKLYGLIMGDLLSRTVITKQPFTSVDSNVWNADSVLKSKNYYIVEDEGKIYALILPCEPTQENIKTIMTALLNYL